MPKRSDADLAEDISEAIRRIESYTKGLSMKAFLSDLKTQDAVVRNLEIIGEAVKGLSGEFKKARRAVKWQDIAGMRDRLIHHYAGVNWEIVWDVIQAKLPELKETLTPVPKSR